MIYTYINISTFFSISHLSCDVTKTADYVSTVARVARVVTNGSIHLRILINEIFADMSALTWYP